MSTINKKITDLPELASLTGNEWFLAALDPSPNYKISSFTLKNFVALASNSWGSIGGTLSNQTDLQAALNLKANTSSLATVATTGVYADLTAKPTLGSLASLSYPSNTTTFLRGDGAFVAIPGTAVWGGITGTLSNQTDLQTALNLKANTASLGTVAALSGPGGTTTFLRADNTYAAPSASVAWGGITGTLSSQSDLNTALGLKAATTYVDAADALKQNRSPAIQSVVSNATVTPTFSNDQVEITAQAAALNLANPTGTAIPALGIVIRIKDNGTARAITYGTQYRAIGVTLPTTTVISKTLYLGMIYNAADTKWDVTAVAQEA